MGGPIFNRIIMPGTGNVVDDSPDEGRHRNQGDTLAVHLLQQHLALRVDKIEIGEIQDRLTILCGRLRSLPALTKFSDPGAGKLAFQFETKFAGAVVQSNL